MWGDLHRDSDRGRNRMTSGGGSWYLLLPEEGVLSGPAGTSQSAENLNVGSA